jgi:SAM-dependent methyltransferase
MKQLIPLSIRRKIGDRIYQWKAEQSKARLLAALAGNAVQCNVCGWEGSRFTDDCWHPGTICPNCGSQVRHRLLVAAFDGQASMAGLDEQALFHGKSMLHFAPERQLRDRLRMATLQHVTADFDRGDCDLRLDISAMPEVADSSFDVLMACDVLEHVPDDHAAFREIHRVLRLGGMAILSVPQKDPPASTDEDASATTEADREKCFGQKDHIRMYGDDFPDRLARAKFDVRVLTAECLSDGLTVRHVLKPPALNSHPLATNERRIYFARKS